MTDQKKGLQKYPEYEKNPFDLEGIFEKSFDDPEKRTFIDNETGEVLSVTAAIKTGTKSYKDRRAYRKLFAEGLKDVMNLSAPGFRLLCYIMYHMRKDVDFVYVLPQPAMDFCEYKGVTQYYVGIRELLDKKFMVRRKEDKNSFFINVNLFFNGNRIKLIEDED